MTFLTGGSDTPGIYDGLQLKIRQASNSLDAETGQVTYPSSKNNTAKIWLAFLPPPRLSLSDVGEILRLLRGFAHAL